MFKKIINYTFVIIFIVDCNDIYKQGGLRFAGTYEMMIKPTNHSNNFHVLCELVNNAGELQDTLHTSQPPLVKSTRKINFNQVISWSNINTLLRMCKSKISQLYLRIDSRTIVCTDIDKQLLLYLTLAEPLVSKSFL